MIPHDAFNVHHKLLNMYDIEGRTAAVTQLWKGFWGRGGKIPIFGCFSLKSVEISAFVGKIYFYPLQSLLFIRAFRHRKSLNLDTL